MTDTTHSWWVIEEGELRRLLNRVKDGDSPDVVLIEEYAQSEHDFGGED